MKSIQIKHLVIALVAVMLFGALYSFSQSGGLRREPGIALTNGLFTNFTAGAAIAQYQTVYLNSSGQVAPAATSGQTTTLVGVAPFACTSGQTNCLIQTWGVATAIADGSISVNSSVGAPTSTAGRLAALSSTQSVTETGFTNGTGSTTVVMGTTNPTVTLSFSGNGISSVVLGRALTAQSTAGSTFTVFIGLK